MDITNLAIATMSWARDEAEEELLYRSLKELSRLQIPVFITDGGSPDKFVKDIRGLSKFHVSTSTGKGLWAQVRSSLQLSSGSGASYILYTEPDKFGFFGLLPGLLEGIHVNEKTGIVLASRNSNSMSTFPAFQQMTESTINNCCAELTGRQLDFTYGPFLMNRDILLNLHAVPDDIGWGWRPYCFNIAARMGLDVTALTGEFHCPVEQQTDRPAERVYRMKQLTENIRGLVLSCHQQLATAQ